MIRSMTGFGAAEAEQTDGSRVRVEIRTVNHRHLNISAGLPKGWEGVRPRVLDAVRARLARGSVSVSIGCEAPASADPDAPALDVERARRYAALLTEAASELGVEGSPDLAMLARLPGVLTVRGTARDLPPPDEDAVVACVESALAGVDDMRADEGRRIEEVLRAGVERVVAEVDAIEARAPERLIRERDRLRERVAKLAGSVEVDEDRLAREVAYLADKWDIAEELARLRAHAEAFRAGLDGGGERPRRAGKRLGFVVQEMHREANTVGSKANDVEIGASAIAIKEELERLREQLENVE